MTKQIEDKVGTLEGVKSMSSTSSENRAMIMLEYDYGTDMDDAYNDLSQSLDGLSRNLPDDTETAVMEMNSNASSTMTLSISNPSREDLYDYVDQTVVPELEQISSVAEVEATGGTSEYYRIELMSDEMDQNQVTMSDIKSAMSSANLYEAEESKGGISRYNGEETISISITKQQSSSAMEVSSAVFEIIEELRAEDEDLKITVARDSADSIISSLKDVVLTLVLAVVISMIIIFIFFGDYKASLIVGSSIPTSILMSLILLTRAGYSLNIITMSGLVLGVGMMVDNSIVVLESCFRALESQADQGLLGYAKAALSGTNVVVQSIIGSTLTTCVVFVPLVFLQGMAGQMFGSMGYIIVFCMCSSLLSAITIVPLSYMMYKPQERVQAPMSGLVVRMQSLYRRLMPGLLKHKAIIMLTSFVIIVGTLFLASGMKTEFMTADDTGTVSVTIDTRPGLLSEKADQALTQAESIVQSHADVENYMLRYNNDSGTITAYLRDDRKMSTDEVVSQWEKAMEDLENCTVTVEKSSSMSFMSNTRGYEVILKGTDYDELKEVSNKVVDEMTEREDVRNVHSSIENTAPVVTVKVDPVLAAAEGLTASQIGSQFESPKFSFMVMTTIPFSLIGSFGLLKLTGVNISMTSILGFLILIGTVVNNGILYVDTVNQYRLTMNLKTALIEAGATHLRPILMTSLTTILSMIPMALAIGDSGSTTQGLAVVNIGGLSVGVIVALFILPIYYALMNGNKKRQVLDL